MIGYIVRVTVSTSRDQDCNPYTLSEAKEFGIDKPTPKKIRDFVVSVRGRFMDSYPSTQGKPSTDCLLPTDVEVIDLAANEKLSIVGSMEAAA